MTDNMAATLVPDPAGHFLQRHIMTKKSPEVTDNRFIFPSLNRPILQIIINDLLARSVVKKTAISPINYWGFEEKSII